MTPAEYDALRVRLQLSHASAAALLGVEPATSRRWSDGTREMPGPATRLLWAIERDPGLVLELLALS